MKEVIVTEKTARKVGVRILMVEPVGSLTNDKINNFLGGEFEVVCVDADFRTINAFLFQGRREILLGEELIRNLRKERANGVSFHVFAELEDGRIVRIEEMENSPRLKVVLPKVPRALRDLGKQRRTPRLPRPMYSWSCPP